MSKEPLGILEFEIIHSPIRPRVQQKMLAGQKPAGLGGISRG